MARAKLKSHRGAAKRFKRTGRGKFVSNPAGRRHLLTSKNRRRKRALRRRNTVVSSVDQRALRRLLPYS